jgi:GAF domain-containing protein
MSLGEKGDGIVDHKTLAIDILQSLNRASSRVEAIRQILRHLKRHLKVSATAIRLKEGQDFPYFVFDGFSDVHIEMEDSLCGRDSEGNVLVDETGVPVLDCMCGRVIRGNTMSDEPFFTEYGSFWSNNTDSLLVETDTEELGETRNVCNAQGYLSVALIPLKDKTGTIGLLQLNDKEPDRFSEELIWFLEGIGESICIALAHLEEENKRKHLEAERLRIIYQYKLRISQLDTLYRISKIHENKDISLDETLNMIATLIPSALQHPEIAVAQLTVEDRNYPTDLKGKQGYRYSAIIQSYGVVLGTLSIGYTEPAPEEYKGPFLEEEIKLVNMIAETVSRIVEQSKEDGWNRSIDKYALVMDKDEISHIMKLVAEDTAISEMDREEYDISDVPTDSSQTMDSYMKLSHTLEVNRALIQKLKNLQSGE